MERQDRKGKKIKMGDLELEIVEAEHFCEGDQLVIERVSKIAETSSSFGVRYDPNHQNANRTAELIVGIMEFLSDYSASLVVDERGSYMHFERKPREK